MPKKTYREKVLNAGKEAVTVMHDRADVQAMRQAAVLSGYKGLAPWIRDVLARRAQEILQKQEMSVDSEKEPA